MYREFVLGRSLRFGQWIERVQMNLFLNFGKALSLLGIAVVEGKFVFLLKDCFLLLKKEL